MVDENEFFRQATMRIFSSLNIESAMKRCMEYLNRYIPVTGMSFGVYEPHLNIGKLIASIWPAEHKKPPETIALPREFWRWFRERWGGKPEFSIVNDIDEAEPAVRSSLSMILPSEASFLHMDLELEQERLGSLLIFAEGKNRYTDAHAHLISLLHEPFAAAISNILQLQEILRLREMLADDNRYLHRQLREITGDTIIGADFGLKGVMEMVRQVSSLNSPVLLLGETGVGKEVIANAIHFSSQRKNGPFIKVNCGAIPENLIDSELFGHEKGAFTGAISMKRGRFERAHSGTIFLDEIAELPLPAQVRLLRVLQHREIERVGGTETIPVDVRIISATHRNLDELVRSGAFREDLWFRLNVFPIMIPPLRRRVEDIPALVSHFIDRKSRELKIRTRPTLEPGALERIQDYHWPGNVRELENLVERAIIQSQIAGSGEFLRFDLPSEVPVEPQRHIEDRTNGVRPLDEVVAGHIRSALALTDGRVEGKNGAAEMLGLHPSTLRGRMRKLSIPYGKKSRERPEQA